MEIIVIRLCMSSVCLLPCDDGYLQIDTGCERDDDRDLRS